MLGDWPDWSADCMLMLSHLHLIVVTIRPSKHFELIIQYLTNQTFYIYWYESVDTATFDERDLPEWLY